ncbi:MAG: extracellular solute-binding protein [Clostridiales bacterium]|nr:extracellular solute-binding protein [Clostridiales bacterium]
MKNSHTAKKALAAVLCLSMLPAFTACKKKGSKKNAAREIKETDPFYDCEMYQLKIPVDESKELLWVQVTDIEYSETEIKMPYYISYEIPPEALTDPKFDYSNYSATGTAVFDLKGNLLRNEEQEEDSFGPECFAIDNEGNKARFSASFNVDPNECEYSIIFTNDNGETVKELPLENAWKDRELSVRSMKFLPDGKIVIMGYATLYGNAPIEVFDANGKHLTSISSMDRSFASDVFMQNGKYYILTTDQETEIYDGMTWKYEVNEIDFDTGAIKPGIEANGITFSESVAVADDGLYNSTVNGISKFDMTTGEMKEILNWNQTDIDHNLLNMIKSYPKNENEIHAIATLMNETTIIPEHYVINLTRAEKNPHAGKQVLYVGGQGISPSFYDFMYKYNADPENDYRIEAVDYYYSELESGNTDNVSAAMTNKVYLDLLGGEGPDILMNFAGTDQFANEELLVDLNTYIDGKNGLDRSEYFDNIFRAIEKDGKLFSIPTAFGLQGYIIDADVIHADRNWTFDDFDREAQALGDSKMLIPKSSPQELLKMYMGPNLADYMDYAKKDVHFNSEGMVHILEEVKKYACMEEKIQPAVLRKSIPGDNAFEYIPYIAGDDEFEDGTVDIGQLLYAGACVTTSVNIYSFIDYHLYTTILPGEGKLVGYPSTQGKGVIATSGLSLSIVANSDYKDEAWEVIKAFLEEDVQIKMAQTDSVLPIRRSAFEKIGKETQERIDRAYQAYLKNKEDFSYYGGVYFPADPNLVDELTEIVESVRFSNHYDEALMNILLEETAGYFSGSRSAEDVLKNVDNRAKQIVQEH